MPGGVATEALLPDEDIETATRQIPLVKVVASVIIVALVCNWFWPEFAVTHAEGVLVPNQPAQGPSAVDYSWEFGGYTITPLAEIDLNARVLHTKKYFWGRSADLSHYDLALGWGPMSDQWVVDQIKFSQRDRWYFFNFTTNPPCIAPTVALNNSANFHTIAATDGVLETISDLKVGHIIRLRGHLVRVDANDGWRWVSSTSRTDRGDGSCELVWVEGIEVVDAGM